MMTPILNHEATKRNRFGAYLSPRAQKDQLNLYESYRASAMVSCCSWSHKPYQDSDEFIVHISLNEGLAWVPTRRLNAAVWPPTGS